MFNKNLLLGVIALICIPFASAYATHRPLDVELGLIDFQGPGCGNLSARISTTVEIPGVLLADNWDFLVGRRSTGDEDIVPTTILPGLNDVTFTTTSSSGLSCNIIGRILGFERGEKFKIGGPCFVQIGSDNEFPLNLIDPITNTPEPELPELITDIGTELRIRIKTMGAGGTFTNHRFEFDGELVNDGLISASMPGGGGPDELGGLNPLVIRFLDLGTYLMEVKWVLPAPPDGEGDAVVSTARKYVFVTSTGQGPTVVEPANNVDRTPRFLPEQSSSIEPTNDQIFRVDGNPSGITEFKIGFLAERKGGSGGHVANTHNPAGTDDVFASHPTQPIGVFLPRSAGSIGRMITDASGGIVERTYRVTEFGGIERVRTFLIPAGEPFAVLDDMDNVIPSLNAEASGLSHDVRQQRMSDVVNDPRFPGCELSSRELRVLIDDLVQLESSSDYGLIGATIEHPNNHYGTEDVINALENIASEYTSTFPSVPVIKYNDISLIWGGGFDVGGNWRSDLSNPDVGHSTHREGKDVDVRARTPSRLMSMDGAPMTGDDAAEFRDIVSSNGGTAHIHGSVTSTRDTRHYHIDFD